MSWRGDRGIPDRWAAEPSDLDRLPSGGRHVAGSTPHRAGLVERLRRRIRLMRGLR